MACAWMQNHNTHLRGLVQFFGTSSFAGRACSEPESRHFTAASHTRVTWWSTKWRLMNNALPLPEMDGCVIISRVFNIAIMPAISPKNAQPDNWLCLAVGQVERSVIQPAASALGQSNFLQHYNADQSHHLIWWREWRDSRQSDVIPPK